LRLKCTKFDFGWGSAPDPTWGAYSVPQIPYSCDARLLRGKGRAKGRGGEGGREGKGRGREWKKR